MDGDNKPGCRKKGFWICCSLLVLGLAACNLPGTGAADPEPTVTGGESQDIELGQKEQALKKGECPEDEIYELLYDHEYVLNVSEAGGDELHFEWNEEAPAYFQIWIDASGKVNNEDLTYRRVNINVSGWLKTNSDECPIAYFQGVWPLTADIQGTCKKGIVKLHVTEHFEDVPLTSTCGGVAGPGPGLYSAPELDLTFDLSVPMTNDGIMSGSRDGMIYLNYWFGLARLHDPLELVPLVPNP